MAESLWNADLTKEMFSSSKGTGKTATTTSKPLGDFAKRQTDRDRKSSRDKRPADRRSAPSPRKDQGVKRGRDEISLGRPVRIKNKKEAQVADKKGNKQFCRYFAKKNCTQGSKCKFEHSCNVLIAEGKICGKNHSASDHSGPFLPA